MNKLRRKIMTRIYLLYGLSLFSHSALWQGVMLSVGVGLTLRYVSFGSVLSNLLNVPLGRVPGYLYQASMTTELWTLVGLSAASFALVTFLLRTRLVPRAATSSFGAV